MGRLRSIQVQEKYNEYKRSGGLTGACNLCEASTLQAFQHWRIIENAFPYDRIAKKHNMIVPREHITEEKISPEAWAELRKLKKGIIDRDYEIIIEGVPHQMTIPSHFHLHLVEIKD